MDQPRQTRSPTRVLAPGDVRARDRALNEALRRGRLLQAYSAFYRDSAGPHWHRDRSGALTRTLRFFQWADAFRDAVPVRTVAADDLSYSEWRGPSRGAGADASTARRVVARRWGHDGKVIREWLIASC